MSRCFEQRSLVMVKEVSFTWKIKNFSAFSGAADCFDSYIESSTFGSSGSYWHLQLFPNCAIDEDLSYEVHGYHLRVRLVWNKSKGDNPGISKVRIGFKTKTNDAERFYGEVDNDSIFRSVLWIVCRKENPGVSIWVDRSKIFMEEPEILLDDELSEPEILLDDELIVFCYIQYLTTMHGNLKLSENAVNDFIHQEGTTSFKSIESILEDSQLSDIASKDVHEEDIYLKQGCVTLSKNIENLFEHSRFSDITVKVGDHAFQAHKAVLASRSKVFEAMFDSGMKEGLENEVNMVEMKAATAKEMLQYIYTGKIQELCMDRAMDLYVAADRYDLQELRGWCKYFILKHISADDVTKVAIMADLHRDEELTIAAKQIFKLNSKTILLSKPWEDFAMKNYLVCLNLMKSALINEN